MPQPSTRADLVRGPLLNASLQYRNQQYIADRLFPVIDRVSPKAKIARYIKGAWFRDEAGIRAAGTQAKRGGYPVDFINVTTNEYAFAKEVTDEDRSFSTVQGAAPLQPEQDAIEFCSDKIDLSKEIRAATLIFTDTTWSGGSEDAAGLWAAGGSNTFIADVLQRIETIRAATGLRPNKLLMDHGTYNSLKNEATLLDRIKHTQTGIVTADLIAAMFDLDEVLIGTAVKNTDGEQADGSDFTAANVWEANTGKGSGFLFYAPPNPGLKTPSAGYQARVAVNGMSRAVKRWREESHHQDVFEVSEHTQMVATGTDLGFLWTDTLTT